MKLCRGGGTVNKPTNFVCNIVHTSTITDVVTVQNCQVISVKLISNNIISDNYAINRPLNSEIINLQFLLPSPYRLNHLKDNRHHKFTELVFFVNLYCSLQHTYVDFLSNYYFYLFRISFK
jgi:hypothetical protein